MRAGTTWKTALRTALVGGLAFGFVPVVGMSSAMACSCIASTEVENFKRADVVFKGTVTGATSSAATDGETSTVSPVHYEFAPSVLYKGEVANPQTVTTPQSGASCGVELSGAGPFLVFTSLPADGDAESGALQMNMCGGTRPIDAGEDPAFGPGEPVDQDLDDVPSGDGGAGNLAAALDCLSDLLASVLGG